MNNLYKTLFIIFVLFGCKNISEPTQYIKEIDSEIKENNSPLLLSDSIDKRDLLIKEIEKNLRNKIEISDFLDSLTKQSNITTKEVFTESFDEKEKLIYYKSKNKEYKLKIIESNSNSNTLFYDGKKIIDFSKHKVLSNNNLEYKTESFGYNFRNRFTNLKMLEIAGKEFLYADIIFDCNGKGCGCQLNFVYDINKKRAFFLDNFRFPYSKYFISDFNNDSIVDMLVIGKNKESDIKGLSIHKLSYQATWFEYKNNNFEIKKSPSSNKPISYEFIAYSTNWEYPETNYSLLIND